jgi:hypothetical protein
MLNRTLYYFTTFGLVSICVVSPAANQLLIVESGEAIIVESGTYEYESIHLRENASV